MAKIEVTREEISRILSQHFRPSDQNNYQVETLYYLDKEGKLVGATLEYRVIK